MYSGRETVRRVAVVASQLPPGSRVHVAETSDEAWTHAEYQAADLTDLAHMLLWATVNRGVEKSKQTKQPEPVPRPADARQKRRDEVRRADTAEKFKEFYDRWKNGTLNWPEIQAEKHVIDSEGQVTAGG